MLALNNIST